VHSAFHSAMPDEVIEYTICVSVQVSGG